MFIFSSKHNLCFDVLRMLVFWLQRRFSHFRWLYGPTDRWAGLPVWSFLYSMAPFWARGITHTDRQADTCWT